jgi:hypothetical protein
MKTKNTTKKTNDREAVKLSAKKAKVGIQKRILTGEQVKEIYLDYFKSIGYVL